MPKAGRSWSSLPNSDQTAQVGQCILSILTIAINGAGTGRSIFINLHTIGSVTHQSDIRFHLLTG